MGTSYRLTIAFVGVTLTSGALACPVTMQDAEIVITSPALLLASDRFTVPVTMQDATLSDGLPAWLSARLAGMSAGDWLDVSSTTPVQAITEVNTLGEIAAWLESRVSKPIVNWPGNGTYDQARSRVLFVGASNGFVGETPQGAHSATTIFSLETGLFEKVWDPLTTSDLGHQYDGNMARPHGDYVYRRPITKFGYSKPPIMRCDLTTDAWTFFADFTGAPSGYTPSLCFFPSLGTTGSIIMAGSGGSLWKYDLTTATMTQIVASSGTNSANEMVCEYHSGADCVVYGAEQLYKLDSAGSTSLLTGVGSTGMSGFGPLYNVTILPDPAGGSIAYVIDNVTTEKFFSLNLTTGALTELGSTPAGMTENAMAASIDGTGSLIFFEGRGRSSDTVSLDRVWLHKVA